MARTTSPRLIPLAIVTFLIAGGALIAQGRMFSWVTDSTSRWLAPISAKGASLRSLITIFTSRADLAQRVRELEDQQRELRAQVADRDELLRQIDWYRSLVEIRQHLPGEPLAASLFSYTRAGGVQQVILNRGSDEGVAVGDVVASARRELVGTIEQVSAGHAVVRMIGDATFEVTARVAESDVAGLIRSESGGSVLLDLVQKDEVIVEGAIILTSGDDRYPAGLIIGTVRSVDREATMLFQVVRVTPAIRAGMRGPVLVLRP